MIDAGILQVSDEDPEIMKQCLGYMKEDKDEESKGRNFKKKFSALSFKMKCGSEDVVNVNSFYQVFCFGVLLHPTLS